ncbi:aminoglycoside N3-acetyltransferase [Halosimplex carlsbadense 2-9-1]|uniref:Aminoglycoside N3-acetyltransferase n=1 Tax=Halosimplex carlsbadense 2-9-1 TaxID=797114 RepID=M0CQX8_9EURY|nr:AAC(3) family N-acetyltransferase [Halosimplex carlsbadense]ELZ24294.1 aminoglycoside N3-acetyltransferase [Halosimplex carlsbadense 2-9-1]
MGERDAVDRVDEPATVTTLADDLRGLGVEPGETLLVHASLSALGWVAGDAQAVVDALREAVTDSGTLVMPAYTGQYTDPEAWSNPPVPDDWVETIRAERPPFRPESTPTRGMGAVAECFRGYPDTVRSRHPTVSFAAWGADTEAVVADHAYDEGLGESSPLAAVYDRGGRVLMLGTGHDTNTSIHLAEYRADFPKERVTNEAPVLEDGEALRVEYEDIETDTSDFAELGAEFEAERSEAVTRGTVGAAEARLVDQPALVDFAVDWFETHRA